VKDIRLQSILSAALLAVCVPAMTACSGKSAPETPPVKVETVTAKVQPIEDIFQAPGILYPLHQASLTPKVTAPVERFLVNRGTKVHRGELLAVLDNQDLQAAVISARGTYDQARATYESTTSSTLPEEIQAARAALTDAKSTLDQQQKLYDSESNLYKEGAIARKQVEATGVALTAAENAYRTASTRLANLQKSGLSQQQQAAKGQMESARGQYLNAEAQLAYTELRSPIDGVVADRAVYPGDVAPAGTPLLTIMDISKVILRLHIPQAEAAQLHVGDAGTLEVPGIQGGVPAKVTIISPALDPNSTTVEIWLEADNPHRMLAPGTSVTASILVRKIPNALVVPESAVLVGDNAEARVMVVGSDSIAHSMPVTTGVRSGTVTQILSGLQPGDRVIVGGAFGLPDGTKVNAVAVSGAAAGAQE
jgi:multidrug efflux pump subunit AcrA (membrane-fusion protein)